MTRDDVMEIIRRAREQGMRADLCWADLHGADLHGANLRAADLHAANLSAANLHGLDLSGADLHAADLRTLIARDDGWPEARGDEITSRRPLLAAFCDMCDAHMAAHPGVIDDLAERWGR